MRGRATSSRSRSTPVLPGQWSAGGSFSVTVPAARRPRMPTTASTSSITLTDAAGATAPAPAQRRIHRQPRLAGADHTVAAAEDTRLPVQRGLTSATPRCRRPAAAGRHAHDTLPGAGQLMLATSPSQPDRSARPSARQPALRARARRQRHGLRELRLSVGDGIDFDATPNSSGRSTSPPVNDPAVIGGQTSGTGCRGRPRQRQWHPDDQRSGRRRGRVPAADHAGKPSARQLLDRRRRGVDHALNNADPPCRRSARALPSETFHGAQRRRHQHHRHRRDHRHQRRARRAGRHWPGNEDKHASGNVLGTTPTPGTTLWVTRFVVNGNTYAAGTSASLAGIGTPTIGSDGHYSFGTGGRLRRPVPVATWHRQRRPRQCGLRTPTFTSPRTTRRWRRTTSPPPSRRAA